MAQAEATPTLDTHDESQPDVAGRMARYLGTDDSEGAEEPEDGDEIEQDSDATAEVDAEAKDKPAEKEADDGGITIDPDAPLLEITTKVEGGTDETKKWSLNEMKAGVMMQKDYQRKTGELAKARENLAQEVRQMIEPERQMYVNQLTTLQQAVQALVMPEFQNVNWDTLATENPAEYVKLSAKAQKAQQAITFIQQQQAEQQRKAYGEAAQQSKKMLSDPIVGIPNWGDELYTTLIQDASKQYGFTPDEVAQVVDWRMIKVLHDAHQYSKVRAANAGVQKKISVVPKVMKPGAQGDASDGQAQDAKLRAQLKKSGSVHDATALYESRQKGRR